MKKTLLIIFCSLQFYTLIVSAAEDNTDKVINQSIQLYNNKNFSGALSVLETVRSNRNQNVNWYYYYALNQTRLNNYDEALDNFETYIKNSNINNTAKAYYFVGWIQFNRGEYEKALNSLELSLDTSNDPQLDKLTEALIDKTLRYQNYFENNKKTNLTFLLGYNYDTNSINLSQDSFADSLNGHVFGYGASISYKLLDQYKFIFEPTLAVVDSYTFDSKFKANSVLQSTDALQVLVSAPIRFFLNEEKNSNKYDFSLNGYAVYLPITTSTRELTLTSVLLKNQILSPVSTKFSIKYNLNIANDKSYGYTSSDDDASGMRYEFLTTFIHYWSEKEMTNIFYDLGANLSNTNGINTRFKKYNADVGYMYPGFFETTATLRIGYSYLNYPEKADPRTDNQVNLGYNMTKFFQSGASVSFSVTAVNNNSNIELSKYSDITAGVQYAQSIGF